ncbi:hypothetical protein MKW98_018945 [Papaver atlanticum]|uniref:KIB1-4 beta-propeller domain-containing protein n=1 Tax=Papaver atlanticum TaxID=357466 RepID=A0AAD4XXX6_9MAGN|nr:hypothetical protein MKW98_018945 [Papaver atlanticum]
MGRSKRVRDNVIISILVLRLDFSEMSWKKVDCFDDKVLFVGSKTSFCCSAAELGLTKGCLYYLEANDQSLYKFELEDNCTTTILPLLPGLKLPTTPWGFTLGWIMMTTSSISDGGRRMEDVLHKHKREDKICVHNAGQENGLRIHNESQELYAASAMDILNQDMVRLIASHIHPVDYVHFRAVSRAKRELLPVFNKTSRIITSTHLSPWFVFLTKNDTVFNFVDPMHNNEKYLMNLTGMLAGSTICFQKGGWLLMSKGMLTYFFYNPFTKETIRLPDVPEPYNFSSICFTSSPTASDCVELGITQAIELVFIRRGTSIWSTSPILEYNPRKYVPCFNVPVFYNAAFYCVDYNGTQGVFNLADETWDVFRSTRRSKKIKYISFLVECEGNILLVRFQNHGMLIRVFRFDFSNMVWVRVISLGSYMLFVSYTSCISAVAPNRRMENKIYLPRLHDEGMLYYSLDKGCYHSVGSTHSAKDFYDTKCWGNCSWIEPNWSRSTLEELDWSYSE